MRFRPAGLILALLAVVLTLGVVACGGGDDEAAPPAETADTATGEGGEGAAAGFETVEEGTLTIGSDIPFPPFEFREGGELTGFDVRLVEEIANRLNLETRWVDTDFETIFTQLAGGRFDLVASATTITEEREEVIDFSRPYYQAQQALAVNAEATPDIHSVEDIGEGDVVAVQRGTTGESWARENLEPQGAEIRSFAQAPDTYTALEAANVTSVVFDEPSAVEEASQRPALEVVDTIDTGEEYGFGVDPNNDPLLEAVNETLTAMIEDGTYSRIYEEWFPDAPAGSVAEGGE